MAQAPQNGRHPSAASADQSDALAIAVAVGWIVVSGVFFWAVWPEAAADDGFSMARLVLVLVAVIVPAVLVAVAARTSREVRNLRFELYQMKASIDVIADMQATHSTMARTHDAQISALMQEAKPEPVHDASDAPAPQTVQDAQPAQQPDVGTVEGAPEQPVSQFASRRAVSRLITPRAAPQAPADQPALALDTPPEDVNPPIDRPDLIKALQFPDDENDTDGFAALRRALRDRGARKLIQASQDVLTLLSQDGIYMDDLSPVLATGELWRRFAKGERGKAMDRVGGIRDQAYLSVVSRRMRDDAIFRDAVHHFLRCFDQLLVTFEDSATDTDLLRLADTRTARAFMLLARATGTFD